VEDEVLIRFDTADQLRALGMAVTEAADAEEALRILESGVRVDLVFTDVRMPGTMDGLGLARAVRARYPGLKVILCSGDDNSIGQCLAEENAMDLTDFLRKPYRIDEVERRIRQLLETPQ
jgi:CheY-like chemotaxis protein